jgi:mRNA interferase RelE/StbE
MRRQVAKKVALICDNPYDRAHSKPLHGDQVDTRSSRIGELRIIFRVIEAELVVLIVRVGPRGDVYKG